MQLYIYRKHYRPSLSKGNNYSAPENHVSQGTSLLVPRTATAGHKGRSSWPHPISTLRDTCDTGPNHFTESLMDSLYSPFKQTVKRLGGESLKCLQQAVLEQHIHSDLKFK